MPATLATLYAVFLSDLAARADVLVRGCHTKQQALAMVRELNRLALRRHGRPVPGRPVPGRPVPLYYLARRSDCGGNPAQFGAARAAATGEGQ